MYKPWLYSRISCIFVFTATVLLIAVGTVVAGPYDPPPTYYNGAIGTGAVLKANLTSAMSAGHIQRNYGSFRYSAAITDADPNNPGNILLAYNRASVPSNWDSGSTWNREHVWPQSRQPGSASNSTTGNLGDPHALRPSNPSVNSSRGNKPFGFGATTGSFGSQGSYYFPGDQDKGDTARQLFYSDTRYASSGISLVNGFPSGNQMGDLQSLIAWHYLDPPDEFELRRNHTIYSSSYNPSYYTNNRNAYIDHPEFVWSVYVDQQNDSQITLSGGTTGADGGSTLALDLGAAYVGGAGPASQNVTINKGGSDGTYYRVTPQGDATSSITGSLNAFSATGADSEVVQVGLTVNTATSGLKGGVVLIDNLDITTGMGSGHGAGDADDVIALSYSVFDHPVASFSDTSLMNSLTIDLGTATQGDASPMTNFSLANYAGAGSPAFASVLDLDSVLGSGDTSELTTDLMSFTDLAQGGLLGFSAALDTSNVGAYSATYTLNLSGANLPGEQQQQLTLNLVGEVTSGILLGDANGDGYVDLIDLNILAGHFGMMGGATFATGDFDGDGNVTLTDLNILSGNWTGPPPAVSVPEPSAVVLVFATLAVGGVWRRV